jgi:hypothetical protein
MKAMQRAAYRRPRLAQLCYADATVWHPAHDRDEQDAIAMLSKDLASK